MKKLARLAFWYAARQVLGLRFYDKSLKFLCLSSYEAGDVSTLRGLGVEPCRIVACDLDVEALDQAEACHPGILAFHGDAAEAAHFYRGQLAAAFLDFCCPIGLNPIRTLQRVCQRGVIEGGVLGVGLMRGREKVDGKSVIRIFEQKVRSLVVERPELGPFEPDQTMRAHAVWQRVGSWATSFGWVPIHRNNFIYHSRAHGRIGVPMLYSLAIKAAGVDAVKEIERRRRHEITESRSWEEGGVWDAVFEPDEDATEEQMLRRTALQLADAIESCGFEGSSTSARIGMVLNLPPAKVAAWLASANRQSA